MRIALFPNLTKPNAQELVLRVASALTAHGMTVSVDPDCAERLALPPCVPGPIDVAITFGGDGSILRVVHRYPWLQCPFLGVNLGRLGFMAEVPKESIERAIEALKQGTYEIEKRITLSLIDDSGHPIRSVNDIVIHRGMNPSLIELSVRSAGRWINTFLADGLIIATPGGSTAYSLAAGGPIVTPELSAIVLTPICPHTISTRPIVLPAACGLEIRLTRARLPAEVAVDGIGTTPLQEGGCLHIEQSPHPFSLLVLPDRDYYHTVRSKLGWSGRLQAIAPQE